MPINKSLTAPNGATVVFHVIKTGTVDFSSSTVNLQVASWPTEQNYNDGLNFLWMWPTSIALSNISTVETTLTTTLGGTFYGGSVVPDNSGTLANAKIRQFGLMKQARQAEIDAPLSTPYGTFDSDTEARGNISDSVLLVNTLHDLGQPSNIDYTLADNSTVTLNYSQMTNVGLLLGAKVQTAYGKSRTVRNQILACTTIPDVQAVTWPA